MPYLTMDEYKARAEMSIKAIDELLSEPGRAGTFALWEEDERATIDDSLRRRYAVPFGAFPSTAEPDPALVPRSIKKWLAAMLDEKFMRARRIPGSEADAGDSDITSAAARAREELRRAADPDTEPRPELPLRADTPGSSGVSLGGPHVVLFTTPFAFWDYVKGLQ